MRKNQKNTEAKPLSSRDQILREAFCLSEKRRTAIHLAQGEQGWLASSLKRLRESAEDDLYDAGNVALEVARHASALASLFSQIDCMNVALASVDEVARAAGFDLSTEMRDTERVRSFSLKATVKVEK